MTIVLIIIGILGYFFVQASYFDSYQKESGGKPEMVGAFAKAILCFAGAGVALVALVVLIAIAYNT